MLCDILEWLIWQGCERLVELVPSVSLVQSHTFHVAGLKSLVLNFNLKTYSRFDNCHGPQFCPFIHYLHMAHVLGLYRSVLFDCIAVVVWYHTFILVI